MKKYKIVDIVNYLEEKDIEIVGPNRRGFINVDCVFCGGNKKLNIYIEDSDYEKGFSNCWVCQKRCGFNEVRGQIEGVDPKEFEKRDVNKNDVQKIKIVTTQSEPVENLSTSQIIKSIPMVKMPELSRLIRPSDKEALDYLSSRGIDFELAEKLSIHIVDKDEYFKLRDSSEDKEYVRSVGLFYKRVIFPVYIGQGNFGYVARDYSGKRPAQYKVLNSQGNLTSSFFWNFNLVRNAKNLVIVEGIFDAINCGTDKAVALLGKTLSSDSLKMRLIQLLNPDVITLYPDNGAYAEMNKMAREISKNIECEIRVVIADPELNKDLSREEIDFLSSLGKIQIKNGKVILAPYLLRIYKDALKAFNKGNLELIKGLPRYKDKNAIKILLSTFDKISNTDVKCDFISDLDYIDAGDRSIEENDLLIKNAQIFNPFFSYHLNY